MSQEHRLLLERCEKAEAEVFELRACLLWWTTGTSIETLDIEEIRTHQKHVATITALQERIAKADAAVLLEDLPMAHHHLERALTEAGNA